MQFFNVVVSSDKATFSLNETVNPNNLSMRQYKVNVWAGIIDVFKWKRTAVLMMAEYDKYHEEAYQLFNKEHFISQSTINLIKKFRKLEGYDIPW